MAEEIEIVRITHQDLVKLSKTRGPSGPKNNAQRSEEVMEAKEHKQGRATRDRNHDQRRRQRKDKRPDMQLYQPVFRRQGKDVEKSNEDLRGSTDQLAGDMEKTSLDEGSQSPATRKRSRRPDIQIYIPKPRIESLKADQTAETESDPGDEDVTSCPVSPPRRVDVGPNSGMLVTVMNDRNVNGSDALAQKKNGPPSSPVRSSPSKSKQFPQSGRKTRNLTGDSDKVSSADSSTGVDWAEEVDQEFGHGDTELDAGDSYAMNDREDRHTHRDTDRRKKPGHRRSGRGGRNSEPDKPPEKGAVDDSFDLTQTLVFERSKGQSQPQPQPQSPVQSTSQNQPAQLQHKGRDRKSSYEEEPVKPQKGPIGRGRGEPSPRDRHTPNNIGNRGRRRHGSGGGRWDNRQDLPNYQSDSSSQDYHDRESKRGGRHTAEEKRHVTFAEDGKKQSSDSETSRHIRQDRVRKKEPEPARAGHGGLIHLPSGPVPDRPSSPSETHVRSPYGRGRGRGRISTRSLYDPHNPQAQGRKPAMFPGQHGNMDPGLQFHDPYEPNHPHGAPNPNVDYMGRMPPNYEYQYHRQYQELIQSGAYSHGEAQASYFTYPGIMYYDDRQLHDQQYYYNYDAGSEGGIQVPAGPGGDKQSEVLLKEIARVDQSLNAQLARRQTRDSMEYIATLRYEMQMKSEELLLADPEYSNNHNVEHHLWKTAFYHVVEMFRKQLHEEKDKETKTQVLRVLEEGVQFYESLLKKLQARFNFSLEDFLDSNKLLPENISRSVKLAILSAQRTMICLGDLARYKEQTNETANYGKARSWYLKAHQLAPKNGRPYNQLAILAVYTRRKLDAVYYYIRSLSATNPFLTAREGLTSLFDEARRKAEASEKKRLSERPQRPNKTKDTHLDSHRIEVWVSPDGSKCQDEVGNDDSDIDEDLIKMSAVELNKRFVLSFLQVQGKLFSKIGMETYPDICQKMLQEFRALLQHSPSPVSSSRLLQLMVINMFMIENTALRETHVEQDHRSIQQEHAIQLGVDMFSLIVERCVELFRIHLDSPDYPRAMLSEDLHAIYPSVKVWCDWMVCHANLWNPPPMREMDYSLSGLNVWQNVCDLCNVLKDIGISHVKLYTVKKDSCDPVILPEDTMMAGFVPLLSMPQDPSYVHNTVDKDIAKDCLRIEKLQLYGDYLCGIQPPVLLYNVKNQMYFPEVVDMYSDEEDNSSDTGTTQSEDSDEYEDADVVVEHVEEEEVADGHVKELRAKKAELERKVEEQKKHQENVQAILENEKCNKPIVLEINPLYLVPDTNCFINHLGGIKRLVECNKYTLVVPLIVINELDGLAKGSRQNQYDSQDHADMVQKGAAATVQYLEEQFNKRNPNLRALTSKGTVMETIAYRSESTDRQGSNDDLILSCCLHYAQDRPSEYMPRKDKAGPVKLRREVVLLTDDRNLCLKALTRNVPVKDLPSFLKWSNIG